MKQLISAFAMVLLFVPASTTAGPEKVAVPPYQTYVLSTVVDRPDVKEIRYVYAIPEAVKWPERDSPSQAEQSSPSCISRVDDMGQLIKDPNVQARRHAER